MDIRLLLDKPTEEERVAVDALLGPPESAWSGGDYGPLDGRVAYGGHALREKRHLLLPALHAVQDAVGSISKGALGYVSERLMIPPAEAYGVATFYALFRTGRSGGRVVHLCDDFVCSSRGGGEIASALDEAGVRWESSPCLGQCDRAPAALVHQPGDGYVSVAPADGRALGADPAPDQPPPVIHQARPELRLLRRVGVVDPTSLEAYGGHRGYDVLRSAIEMGPDEVIGHLESSRLRGRGGAAFPIGAKWRGLRQAAGGGKFVIANGDESEPGTFKDRVLMEGDPFALVEAMTVYAYATGAEKGFIYMRGEYPLAERRILSAIAQAKGAGLLGDNVADAGFNFDLELRRGAGAYICGEETALFASIEGHRGEPRQKPPFPTDQGVFGMPTGVNNIETLLAALAVLEVGGEAFSEIGTHESTGPKLFCVSGDVERPGVYEVPLGTELDELLRLSGAIEPMAVLMGGAAGSFVDEDQFSMPLSFEGARTAGTTLGSGAIIVFSRGTDFSPVLRRIARFFRDESCGQCVPCRIGTVRQEEALARLDARSPLGTEADERRRLDDLAAAMTDSSICGLGQTAASAIQSAIRLGLPGAPS